MVIGGAGGRLKIAGRYVRYPKYGDAGHRTIGNWWTTWLNAFGNPIQQGGNLDLEWQKKWYASARSSAQIKAVVGLLPGEPFRQQRDDS